MKKLNSCLTLLFLLCAFTTSMSLYANDKNSKGASRAIKQYHRYQKIIDPTTLSQYNLISTKNPFDKSDIYLEATFTPPNGGTPIIINGFYADINTITLSTDCTYSGWDYLPVDQIASTTPNRWVIRFTPQVVGSWNLEAKFVLPEIGAVIPVINTTFDCAANSITEENFINFDDQKKFFKYSDGTPINLLGINLPSRPQWGHTDCRPITSYYELYFKRLNENGANFARIWINFLGGVHLQHKHQEVKYLSRFKQSEAAYFDKVIELAEQYNIKIQLCIDNHNNLYGENWDDNAYYVNTPGAIAPQDVEGSCTLKRDYFSNQEAIEHQNNFFKYVIDRWGYSPAIISWEIANEMEHIKDVIGEDTIPVHTSPDFIPWHENAYNLIKSYGKYNRPVSTSFATVSLSKPFLTDIFDFCDFTQTHRYISQWAFPGDDSREMYFELAEDYINEFSTSGNKKPTFVAESGSFNPVEGDPGVFTNFEINDPNGFTYHAELWASLFSGAFTPTLTWHYPRFVENEDPSHPGTIFLAHINAISKFVKNIPNLGHSDYISSKSYSDHLRYYYLQDPNTSKVWGWVQDDNFHINNLMNYTTSTMSDYVLSFDQSSKPSWASQNYKFDVIIPSSGNYAVHWYNPENGIEVKTDYALVTGSHLTLLIPEELRDNTFGDAAFYLEKQSQTYVPDDSFKSSRTVLNGTDVLARNGGYYYADSEGTVRKMVSSQPWNDYGIYVYPDMKSGSDYSVGLALNPTNTDVYYTAYNNHIYRYYYSGSNWYNEKMTSSVLARADSELKFMSNQVIFVSEAGTLMTIWGSPGNWRTDWLNSSAPKVKAGTGICNVPNQLAVYYISATDSKLYKMYYSSSQSKWLFEKCSNSYYSRGRADTEIHYNQNTIFYVRYDGMLMGQYKSGSAWNSFWLNPEAPKVKIGTGFSASTETPEIHYTGEDGNIYRMYYSYSLNKWRFQQINIADFTFGGVKLGHDLLAVNNSIVYVGNSDTKLHKIDKNISKTSTIDPDEVQTYKPTQFLNKEASSSNVNIYPNPNKGIFTINSIQKLKSIRVFDISGNLCQEVNANSNEIKVTLNNNQSGMYLIQIITDQSIENKRIIVN